MIINLIRNIFVVEDDTERTNSERINTFIELLSIADRTRDKEQYERILRETREISEDYLLNGNPLGYVFLAEWFYHQKDAPNALLFHLLASKNGLSYSRYVVKRFSKNGKIDYMHALLLAESYFIIGNDFEGRKWLIRAKKLGFKAADQGIAIRNNGNIRKVRSFQDIGGAVDSFTIRLFKNYVIDYSEVDNNLHRKCADFCRGYAFVKGADIQIDEELYSIEISHGYRERVLVDIAENSKREVIKLKIDSAENNKEAIDLLLQGNTVVIDYTNCPKTEAQESFDFIGGCCFGLKGEMDRKGDNVFILKPGMKEYNGESSRFEDSAA